VKYLLDTDHLSILQWQTGDEYDRVAARCRAHEDETALSIVSFHEQALGCHTYISRARDDEGIMRGYKLLGRVIQDFMWGPLLLFDSKAAATFADLKTAKVRIATLDLRIASIALSRRLTLVTRNLVDFSKVPGLTTEDWTRQP
jgi:tRNA(fMet)-specific endonuclease VapC